MYESSAQKEDKVKESEQEVGEFLRAEDLARWLGISRTKAYSLVWHELPSYAVGRVRLVRRQDVEVYLKQVMHRPKK